MFPFFRTEYACNMVRITSHCIQKVPFAGQFIIGDSGFHQVSGTVQYMIAAQHIPLFPLFKLGEIGVEKTIFLLRTDDQFHNIIQLFCQCFVGVDHKKLCKTFDDFRHIGIPENMGLVGISFFPIEFEGIDTPCDFTLMNTCREGGSYGNSLTGSEYVIRQFDVFQIFCQHGKILSVLETVYIIL